MSFLQKKCKFKSFLKWAGGKSSLLDFIIDKIPENTKRFIEPFAGSMVVSLNVNCDEIIINDTNQDLINLYKANATVHTDLIKIINEIFAASNNNLTAFNLLKQEFNNTQDTLRKSALFVYLNRHCFNGLCRYNSRGEFNVPFGKYKSVNPPIETMKSVSELSKNFKFYNSDFESILKLAKSNDCFYCDPPYLPYHIDETRSNFTQYATNKFDLKDHIRLIEAAKTAVQNGAVVLISNHSNEYIDNLYKNEGAIIHSIQARRYVAASGSNRQKVKELLAVFSK
jgi:DNA adenine methylase